MKIGPVTLTRDSAWWGVSAVLSFAAVLATLTDTSGPMSLAYYGIPAPWLPYIRLAGLLNTWFSGKMSNSWAPSSGEVARGIRDNGRPLALLLVLGLAIGATGCASLGTARHRTTVSVASAHAVLTAIREGELLLVCGKPSAPAPPACVSADRHRDISAKLVTAFDYDVKVAQLVRAVPADVSSDSALQMLGQIGALIDAVFKLIPESAAKGTLAVKVGAQ